MRVDDINYREHLAHDKVLTLCHEARRQFFESKKLTEMDLLGKSIIMVDCAVQYKNEGHLGDELTFELGTGDFSGTSFSIYYTITHKNGQEVARAKTTLGFYDYDARKVQRAPENLEAFFT